MLEPLALEHDRKTTLPGLREALNALPPRPPILSFAEYVALPEDERAVYDEARDDFMRLTLRVPTPEQDLSARILAKLIASNPRRKNSRRGLMISAPMFYGKTELALLLARSVEHEHAKRFPDYAAAGEVPVVWVEVTDHATGKALLSQIVRFLAPTVGLPTQITTEELRRRTVDLLHIHRTKLLVIDEAHNLSGSDPSSVIKALQNESSATVALVGISLASGKAFGSGAGLQVTMRCDMVELRKIDGKSDDGLALWRRWVAIFDRNLPLCDHVPGTLTRNARVLHKAANGRLAVLAMIVERLVASIVDDPHRQDEQVTRERLFAVLDSLRHTTAVRHRITLDDLVEAA
ncbi:TniB family NTP-binding protein [Microbacterium sp. ASV81]|uniref:TniB family NTP-binding protein n=1 Tax=Microbacterium capsulatum TaxID=3041921 RepID=A0ABU0XIT6_9MICO|nr:TniB family NTP-binding protein [Microbacterium sp. ASV81]MDQ4215054.1 TniB family NTP-binding protein [Microbacterium sp. ASV81]